MNQMTPGIGSFLSCSLLADSAVVPTSQQFGQEIWSADYDQQSGHWACLLALTSDVESSRGILNPRLLTTFLYPPTPEFLWSHSTASMWPTTSVKLDDNSTSSYNICERLLPLPERSWLILTFARRECNDDENECRTHESRDPKPWWGHQEIGAGECVTLSSEVQNIRTFDLNSSQLFDRWLTGAKFSKWPDGVISISCRLVGDWYVDWLKKGGHSAKTTDSLTVWDSELLDSSSGLIGNL